MQARFLAGFVLSLLSLPVFSQMVSQTAAGIGWNFGNGNGQSFTATASGTIKRISLRTFSDANNGTLRIYNGGNGSGISGGVGTPAYEQFGVSILASPLGGPMRDISLTTPFPVVAGNVYSFLFQGAGIELVTGNPYAGGTIIGNFADIFASQDTAFQVWLTNPQTITFTSVAPVGARGGISGYIPTATASSGLTVTFTADPSSSGVCSVSGGSVYFIDAGTCTINANQAGNSEFDPAPQVQQSFAVGPNPAVGIPTLSEWGLIFMSGLLAIFGLVSMKRRKAGT